MKREDRRRRWRLFRAKQRGEISQVLYEYLFITWREQRHTWRWN